MTLFKKPLVCSISSTKVKLFDVNKNISSEIPFTPETSKFSEITNKNNLDQSLQDFFKNVKNGEKIIIFVCSDLIFESSADAKKDSIDSQAENFLSLIPIRKENVSVILYKNKENSKFLASNKKLYTSVYENLQKYSANILSVTPASVFTKISSPKDISIEDAKIIAGSKGLFGKYNFIDGFQSVGKETADEGKENTTEEVHDASTKDDNDENENKTGMKQIVFLFISLVFLGGSIAFLVFSGTLSSFFGGESKPTASSPEEKVSAAPTQTPKPTIGIEIDKESIKIQILNGSGIAGQAGEVGTILEEAGFPNISTGNTEESIDRTTIVHLSSVPQAILDEITSAIKDNFPDPTIKPSTQSSEFDLIITTGSF